MRSVGDIVRRLTCLGVVLLLPCSWSTMAEANENDAASFIVSANSAYDLGDFSRAASLYEQAIASGVDNGHVYYNLANALYRLGRSGAAIAAYRRALEQYPRDADIRANLALARKKAVDKLELESDKKPIIDVNKLLVLNSLFSRYELQWGFLAAYTIAWLCFAAWFVYSCALTRSLTLFALAVAIIVGISIHGTRPGHDGEAVFAVSPSSRSIRPAVITADTANAYSGDSEKFQVVFVLHEGAEIDVNKQRKDWVEVLLPGNRRGWVRRKEIEVL